MACSTTWAWREPGIVCSRHRRAGGDVRYCAQRRGCCHRPAKMSHRNDRSNPNKRHFSPRFTAKRRLFGFRFVGIRTSGVSGCLRLDFSVCSGFDPRPRLTEAPKNRTSGIFRQNQIQNAVCSVLTQAKTEQAASWAESASPSAVCSVCGPRHPALPCMGISHGTGPGTLPLGPGEPGPLSGYQQNRTSSRRNGTLFQTVGTEESLRGI